MRRRQRYDLYDPEKDRVCKVNSLYGQRAKNIYRSYMNDFGWQPNEFLPDGLTFNGRFSYNPQVREAALWRSAPQQVNSTFGLRGMVAAHTIYNHSEVRGVGGFQLIKHFKPVIESFLRQNDGCSHQFNAKLRLVKSSPGATFRT